MSTPLFDSIKHTLPLIIRLSFPLVYAPASRPPYLSLSLSLSLSPLFFVPQQLIIACRPPPS